MIFDTFRWAFNRLVPNFSFEIAGPLAYQFVLPHLLLFNVLGRLWILMWKKISDGFPCKFYYFWTLTIQGWRPSQIIKNYSFFSQWFECQIAVSTEKKIVVYLYSFDPHENWDQVNKTKIMHFVKFSNWTLLVASQLHILDG